MRQEVFRQYPNLSDEEMVVLFQKNGDMQLLGSLYHRYLSMITGVCLKYLGQRELAEDAVMEIFEILHRRLPNHQVEVFSAWLYRVASNHCLDILRKQKRTMDQDQQIVQSIQSERHNDDWLQSESEMKEEILLRMEKCLERLKNEQQLAIRLFYLESKSYEEVALQLDATWAQTRSFIQNGRRNMKNCMEREMVN